MAINSILKELQNRRDGSPFADDLAIYIAKNQRNVRSYQQGRYMASGGRTNLLHKQGSEDNF